MTSKLCGWPSRQPFIRGGVAALASLFCASAALAANIDRIDTFRNVAFVQTANGPVLSANGAFFSTLITPASGVGFDSAVLSYPGPASPLTLTAQDLGRFGYQSLSYPTQADMNAAFPAGNYQYTLTAGISPTVVSFDLGADHYALSQPYLAGSSYAALQGMNAAATMNLQLSPFVVDGAAGESFVFFTIYDYTLSQRVFDVGFLPSSTTAISVPGGTLQPGHSYTYELNYDSRLVFPSTGVDHGAQVGWDLRTSGLFTSAVPEPSSALMWVAGLLFVAGSARRFRRVTR